MLGLLIAGIKIQTVRMEAAVVDSCQRIC